MLLGQKHGSGGVMVIIDRVRITAGALVGTGGRFSVS